MRHGKLTAVLVLGALTGGCATNELETRRKASDAALAAYPGNARQAGTFQVAAVDDPGRGVIELVNLTDAGVPAGKLWVNARFVAMVPAVPARSTIAVKYGDLLESGVAVADLGRAKVPVAKVELEVPGQGLVTVLGPGKR